MLDRGRLTGVGLDGATPLTPGDAREADWLIRAAPEFGDLVPAGFPSYVRIFHPAYRGLGTERKPARWAEIAARTGRKMHATVDFAALVGHGEADSPPQHLPGLYDEAPDRHPLPTAEAAVLAPFLAATTSTPERCWFAVWEGYGNLTREIASAPQFEVPGRVYHLLSGPVVAASDVVTGVWPSGWSRPLPRQTPDLWWPDDHAWFVASDTDLDWTLVGCNQACRDGILALPELEALDLGSSPAFGYEEPG